MKDVLVLGGLEIAKLYHLCMCSSLMLALEQLDNHKTDNQLQSTHLALLTDVWRVLYS